MAITEKTISEKTTSEKRWLVGQRTGKFDGEEKVNGELKYVEDIVLPRMLYGAILRSPHAHAIIKKIDVSKALGYPGVKAVITAEDTPKIKFSYNIDQSDNLVLCDEKVRFIGDEVAAVACETPEQAQKALELIDVEYELLPGVFTIEEAMQEGAPLVHEDRPGNISYETHVEHGDVEQAFASADFVFEDTFETSKQAHCCLERRGCIVQYDQKGNYTVWSQTQTPHTLRKEMAHVLDVEVDRIHVLRMPIGGGFGNRLVMDMKEPIAAFLSQRTKRPVQIVNTRREEFETARTRYLYKYTIKTAVNKDGKIVGRHIKTVADAGAYGDKGPNTMGLAVGVNGVFYNVEHTKFDGYIVYTNNQYGTGFRGFGNPQINFAIESQMDLLAQRLNLDPIELRMRNANIKGDMSSGGKLIDTTSMPDALNIACEKSDFLRKWEEYNRQPKNLKTRKGIGLASMMQSGGGNRKYGYNSLDAFIKLSETGQMTIIAPGVEMGQGTQTNLAQIAGEVLGIPMDKITIVDNDTNIIPYDLGSFGSRTTYVNGLAVKDAAEQAKSELMEIASKMFERSVDELVLKEGKVGPMDDWAAAVPIKEVTHYAISEVGHAISGKGRFFDSKALPSVRGEGPHGMPVLVFGCQVAEVEVDVETGQVKVVKVTAVHDVGKAINPTGVEGQLEGGIIQGIGYALTEGIMEKDGKAQNPSFLDYKILSSPDIPDIDIHLIEDEDNDGPFGAKGVGEQGITPTAPAIANAVENAIGVRITDLPLKPEKVLKHLKGNSK